MSRQEPESWQPEAQDYQEPAGASFGRVSGPLGSFDREIASVSPAQPAVPPAVPRGRVIALGVIRIVLSGCGMALSIVTMVAGILLLALSHGTQVPLGITLVVLGPLGLAVSIVGLVLSIVALARRVGTVRGRYGRVRGTRWPPQQF